MRPQADLHDAFDAGFEAEDDFAAPSSGEAWTEQAAAQLDPFAMPAPPVTGVIGAATSRVPGSCGAARGRS